MLRYALIFLVIAIIAAVFRFRASSQKVGTGFCYKNERIQKLRPHPLIQLFVDVV